MMTSDGGNGMVMPVAPMYGGNGGGYGSNGFGWGDGAFWIIILFLFAFMGNGWGGGFGGFGGGGMMPWMMTSNTNNDVQRGFDQQSVMAGINGINAGINSLAQGQCSGFAGVNNNIATTGFAIQNGMNADFNNVNTNLTNGFYNAETAANTRQMAEMQQNWAMQTSLGNQLNTIAMNQQNCCCENRAAVADLKYTVATEACADRAAVDGALRDVTAQGVANTTAILNTMNAGIQSIKDQLCQDKIDAKNETIANLRQELAMKDLANSRELSMKDLAASQIAQNGVLNGYIQSAQNNLLNELRSCPIPAQPVYGSQPIFTCPNNGWNPNYGGCGCGMNA